MFIVPPLQFYFFFFNDTATTEIYTLSLHDALPICGDIVTDERSIAPGGAADAARGRAKSGNELIGKSDLDIPDRKSTRLNSSHLVISYAVFCLKKKKKR